MKQGKSKEIILNKMEQEESIDEFAEGNSIWSKKETFQTLWYFIIAFILLLAFGFLINKFLL